MLTPSRIKLGLGIAAALAVGWHIVSAELEISDLKGEVTTLQSDLHTARTNEANLSAALAAQNQAVTELETEARERAERAAQALSQAYRENADLEDQLSKIRDSPVTGNSCDDADTLINEVFQL